MDEKSAVIDGVYRYSLIRQWDEFVRVVFVMLNPSTADAKKDDPTIRRCILFAQKWGYGGIEVVNLFAYRTTNPKELERVPDPIGRDNDFYIRQAVNRCGLVVAAWGANPIAIHRAMPVVGLIKTEAGELLRCLGKTKSGAPRHPLYVPAEQKLESFKL